MSLLGEHAPEDQSRLEFPIATELGTRVPDVIWVTESRREEMRGTGDPPTLAPRICIEVMSENNDWDEMDEKRELYLEAGAEEVWIVSEDGEVQFFGEEERESSGLVPEFPKQL